MRKQTILLVVVVVSLLLVPSVVHSYKDKTHQALTKSALQVARMNDQDLPIDFAPKGKFGQQVINGAGRHFSGEDYTKYWVLKFGCKYHVIRFIWPLEPLNHFRDGMYRGKPALVTAERFYEDAVKVWIQGDKEQAAFILGRALHVVEDMAQPHTPAASWGGDACGVIGRWGVGEQNLLRAGLRRLKVDIKGGK